VDYAAGGQKGRQKANGQLPRSNSKIRATEKEHTPRTGVIVGRNARIQSRDDTVRRDDAKQKDHAGVQTCGGHLAERA
ncbi:hypothetical protein E4U53_005238, partial [Claviceps sorghi]